MKNKHFGKTILIAGALCCVPTAALMTGCGGGSDRGPSTATNAFAGRYTGSYAGRGNGQSEVGNINLSVAANGKVSGAAASPSLTDTIPLSGTLSKDGKLSVSGTKVFPGANTATFQLTGDFINRSGVLSGDGNFRFSVAGQSATGTFTTRAVPATPKFTGNYSGSYTGDERGNFAFVINADDTITATAISPSAGRLRGTGLIDQSTGLFTGLFSYKFDGATEQAAYQGTLVNRGSVSSGEGQWATSTGLEGQFNVNKR